MTARDCEVWYEGCVGLFSQYMLWLCSLDKMKVALHLRPFSSMTEAEAKHLYCISPYSKGSWLIKSVIVKENGKGFEPNIVQINWGGNSGGTGYSAGTEYLYFNKLESEQHRWLLSQGFDVFQLIPAGLAKDITAMPSKEQTVQECDATKSKSGDGLL
jgi:hypothetical protein